MKPKERILIVGGTGMLGKELVAQLLQAGNDVSILTRHPEKAVAKLPSGINIVKGDLIDKPSLMSACHGMDVVIAAAHAIMGKGKYTSHQVDDQGHRDLIDAAKQSGVKYFIYTSVIGIQKDSPIDFWRTKIRIENYLKQSGLAYNIIRASAFMELHVGEFMAKSIHDKGKVTVFGKGENPINFVSVRDVASLMLYCLDKPELRNSTLEIGGLDNVSRKEVIEMYAASTGKKIKIAYVPRGVLKVMSTLIKPFHPGLSRIMFVSQYLDAKDESFDVRPLLKNIPLKITRMKDFIRAG